VRQAVRLPPALAQDGHGGGRQIQIRHVQGNDFAPAQPQVVEQAERRPVVLGFGIPSRLQGLQHGTDGGFARPCGVPVGLRLDVLDVERPGHTAHGAGELHQRAPRRQAAVDGGRLQPALQQVRLIGQRQGGRVARCRRQKAVRRLVQGRRLQEAAEGLQVLPVGTHGAGIAAGQKRRDERRQRRRPAIGPTGPGCRAHNEELGHNACLRFPL
jgi:hypothetical protein